MTKADLAGSEGVEQARAIINDTTVRPLPLVEVSEGVIDPRVILGLNSAAEDDLAARPSHHDQPHDHDHEDFESIIVELPEQTDPEALVTRIESMAKEQNILRVKGYVAVANKPMRMLVQAVGARVRTQYDRPWRPDEKREGRLVVIAEHDDINTEAINKALAS